MILDGNQVGVLDGQTPFQGNTANSAFNRIIQSIKKLNFLNNHSGAAKVGGLATLVAGTVTVTTTAVQANSVIVLTPRGNTNAGLLDIQTITPGVSFVIRSANASDVRVIAWQIINPQA